MLLLSQSPPSWHRCTLLYAFSLLSIISSPISASISYDPFSATSRCPPICQNTADHSGWGIYRDTSQLANCNQTILLDLNLNHGLDSESLSSPIRACSVQHEAKILVKRQSFSVSSSNGTNSTTFDGQPTKQDLQITLWLTKDITINSAALTAVSSALVQAVKSQETTGSSIFFAMSGEAIAGVYAGSQVDNEGFGSIIKQFGDREAGSNIFHTAAAAQLCGKESLGSQILGIFVDGTGDLDAVKAALGGWNNATCLSLEKGEIEAGPVVIKMVDGKTIPIGPKDGGTPGKKDIAIGSDKSKNNRLEKRGTCKYTQAVSGDGCFSIPDRCAITQAQLISYNNDANLCSSIQVGQYVCCSAGTLPDFSPQPNADGTCKSYTVKSGDYCAAIAEANTMTTSAIESLNKQTWGWTGCSYLLVGAIICLSTGSPPMPAGVANAVCGPTVPGAGDLTSNSHDGILVPREIQLTFDLKILASCQRTPSSETIPTGSNYF